MFAKTIVLSDAFLDLPLGSRCLYYTLGMLADDDGFVNSPRSIMRQVGASPDDLKILQDKKFILAFEDGVVCVKHWRINNYLRSDRYTATKYIDDKKMLSIDKNGAYTFSDGVELPVIEEKEDVPPTLDEVKKYIEEKKYNVNAESFFNYYVNNDWKDSKGFSAVRTWKGKLASWNVYSTQSNTKKGMGSKANYKQTKISESEFDALFTDLEAV